MNTSPSFEGTGTLRDDLSRIPSSAVRRRLQLNPAQSQSQERGQEQEPIRASNEASGAIAAKQLGRRRGAIDKENVGKNSDGDSRNERFGISSWSGGGGSEGADYNDLRTTTRTAMLILAGETDQDDSFVLVASPPRALLALSPSSVEGVAAQLYGQLTAARALRRLAAHARRAAQLRAKAPGHHTRATLRRFARAWVRHVAIRAAAADAAVAARLDVAADFARVHLLRRSLRAVHRLAGVLQWRRERHAQLALLGLVVLQPHIKPESPFKSLSRLTPTRSSSLNLQNLDPKP